MTTRTQMYNPRYNKHNIADSDLQPKLRRKRPDIAAQFEDAGFNLVSHNIFEVQSYGQTFTVSPSWDGLKVANETMHAPQIFDFGTTPEIIADWIVGYAHTRYLAEDWLTANLPQAEDDPNQDNAPACYGLGKGEY